MEEDCPITTISENKGFPSVLANRTIRFKVQQCNRLNLNFLNSQETALKINFMNITGQFAKKLENLLLTETILIGQSSSKCPGSSKCIIKDKKIVFQKNLVHHDHMLAVVGGRGGDLRTFIGQNF